MDKFVAFVHTAYINLLSWFGVESQKVASFLYPIIKEGEQLAKSDALSDIIGGIPVVAAAFTAVTDPVAGLVAALAAAEGYIVPVLEKQGVTLAQTTINTLANGLVAQAQASLAANDNANPPAPAAAAATGGATA